MKKEIAIAALGELLIDFTEAGISKNGRKLFEQNPGGAPANLLTVASHMGYRTAFIGKIGTDMHGAFLKKTLQQEGIATGAVVEDDHLVLLTTCTSDMTNGRNILVGRLTDQIYPEKEKAKNVGTGIDELKNAVGKVQRRRKKTSKHWNGTCSR